MFETYFPRAPTFASFGVTNTIRRECVNWWSSIGTVRSYFVFSICEVKIANYSDSRFVENDGSDWNDCSVCRSAKLRR